MSPNDAGHERESLERRIEALERAVSADEPIDRIDRIDKLETRVVELEAAVQALRGYVGSVRAINEEVERRADRALRTAEAVERNVSLDDREPESVSGDDTESESDGTSTRSIPLLGLEKRL